MRSIAKSSLTKTSSKRSFKVRGFLLVMLWLTYKTTDSLIEIMISMVREKEIRSIYCSKINKFVEYLVRVSSTLKAAELSQRKKRLKTYLIKANKWLAEARAHSYEAKFDKSEIKNYLFGITFPFSYDADSKTASNLVINKKLIFSKGFPSGAQWFLNWRNNE